MLVENNVALQPLNTFGIAARAQRLARLRSEADLAALMARPDWTAPVFVLGGGSNLVITGDIKALVLKVDIPGKRLLDETPKGWLVEAGAGENWHAFVAWTLAQGWPGLENMALIPGLVGASPVQNIGAYGREIKDVFVELEAQELETGARHTFSLEDCQFGYRDSIFKQPANRQRYFITSVSFRLSRHHHSLYTHYGDIQEQLKKWSIHSPTPQDVAAAVIEIRRSKLPDWRIYGNGGSFFKNPVISEDHFRKLQIQFPGIPSYPADDKQVKVPAG